MLSRGKVEKIKEKFSLLIKYVYCNIFSFKMIQGFLYFPQISPMSVDNKSK